MHQASTDEFTPEQLADAEDILQHHMHDFYRMDYVGWKLRDNAISSWCKKLVEDGQYSADDLKDEFHQLIAADIQDDVDIKNAIEMNIDYQKTQNAGGL